MKNMIDIDVVLDEDYTDPKVTIQTKAKTEQVARIIEAIDEASDSSFPVVMGYRGDELVMVSQRDIVRVYITNRRILIQTDKELLVSKKSLTALEEILNAERFLRISQSEIVNLYKVQKFDFTSIGTIGVEFESGNKSWVSRSRVKALRSMLKKHGS